MQYFKGDELELKIIACCDDLLTSLNTNINEFYSDAYNCKKMAELIYDNDLMPLTNAIRRDIFLNCFIELFEAWSYCGSFESYLTVFTKIFGTGTTIEFTVPGPGKLEIEIEATGFDEHLSIARHIEDDNYIYNYIITQASDNIIFRMLTGIQTQYDCEKLLFTMVPNGIYTEINLIIS